MYLRRFKYGGGVKNVAGTFRVNVGQQGLSLVLGQGFYLVSGGIMNVGCFYCVSLCFVWKVCWVPHCLLLCKRSEAAVLIIFMARPSPG